MYIVMGFIQKRTILKSCYSLLDNAHDLSSCHIPMSNSQNWEGTSCRTEQRKKMQNGVESDYKTLLFHFSRSTKWLRSAKINPNCYKRPEF